MTEQEWAAIARDLNGTFAGGFPPDRKDAFWKYVAADMAADKFDALMRVVVSRQNYAPTPHEFLEVAREQAGDISLPWSDVWPVCQEAAHRCGAGNANDQALAWAASQGVDTTRMVARNVLDDGPGDTPGPVLAAEVVRVRCGDVAAEWFASYGRAAIVSPSAAFGDADWGTKAIRTLGESYEQHAVAAPVRQARAALASAQRPALGA